MTTREGGSIAEPESVPGLSRQVASDTEYLTNLRTNWVKNLAPQIVVPNQAWLGQVPSKVNIPLASTDPFNAWSRVIHQTHDFRDKQIFYGN